MLRNAAEPPWSLYFVRDHAQLNLRDSLERPIAILPLQLLRGQILHLNSILSQHIFCQLLGPLTRIHNRQLGLENQLTHVVILHCLVFDGGVQSYLHLVIIWNC